MGSDYNRIRIASWETINGVEVPLDEYGHYLDWESVSEDKSTSIELTNPYGLLHYAVGGGDECEDGDWMTCFDFAELPDGRIVLHAVVNTDSGGYIGDADYEVVDRESAVRVAQNIVDNAVQGVFDNDLTPDIEGWNQSPCYFWRSVQAHIAGEGPVDRIVEDDGEQCDDDSPRGMGWVGCDGLP